MVACLIFLTALEYGWQQLPYGALVKLQLDFKL